MKTALPALFALLLALPAAAAPMKIAMMPLAPGEGITPSVASALTEATLAEIRRIPDVQVMSQSEVAGLLDVDRQKQLLGCTQDSCLAEIAGAVGSDRVIFGSVAKLGESWLVNLKLFDNRRAKLLAQADRRKRGGTIDDVLDLLGPMVAELFGNPAAAPPQPAAVSSSAAATGDKKPVPPPWAENAAELTAEQRAKLKVATDGKGHFVAFSPYSGTESLVFAGDDKALFKQRIRGSGAQGDTSFDYYFWEPRMKASFSFRDGKYALECGKDYPYTALSDGDAKKLLAKAKLFDVRWQRQGYALLRDDNGVYYFVDQAREPEGNADFHFFVGNKGKAQRIDVNDAMTEGGLVLLTSAGKLKVTYKDDGKHEGEWQHGAVKTPLVWLDVVDYAKLVYADLGAYAGEKLGTVCDPYAK